MAAAPLNPEDMEGGCVLIRRYVRLVRPRSWTCRKARVCRGTDGGDGDRNEEAEAEADEMAVRRLAPPRCTPFAANPRDADIDTGDGSVGRWCCSIERVPV